MSARPPRPEPGPVPPHDPHTPPLDDPSDSRWLAEDDPRRLELERRRHQERPLEEED